MPPERNAPSGTSLTRCEATAPVSTSRSCSTASASDPPNVSAAGSCQYCSIDVRPLRHVSRCPGGSFRMLLKIEPSRGVYKNDR